MSGARMGNEQCLCNSTHTALPLKELLELRITSQGDTCDNSRAKPAILWCSVPDTCHFADCLSQLHLVLRDSRLIISVIADKHVQY